MAMDYQFMHACMHSTWSSKHYTCNACGFCAHPKYPVNSPHSPLALGSTLLNAKGSQGRFAYCANNKSDKNNHVVFIIKKKKAEKSLFIGQRKPQQPLCRRLLGNSMYWVLWWRHKAE